MPLYEYYCESCDRVFEALRALRDSELPSICDACGREAKRIMTTTFASMSLRDGWRQRVPYHHHKVRGEEPKRPIVPLKEKTDPGQPSPPTQGRTSPEGKKS